MDSLLIEAAEKAFGHAVVAPACEAATGVARLLVLIEHYLRYLEIMMWCELLLEEARAAHSAEELLPSSDPSQLVFELSAFAHEANFNRRLLEDPLALKHAFHAVDARIELAVSKKGRHALKR